MTNEGSKVGLDVTARDYASGQRVFGRYTLRKVLGRGGMGIVWLARDEELERDVALKFLPDLVVLDRALLLELKHETRRSLELTHKNIVRIYDFVHGENSACISMEYIDGDTLSNLRAEKEQKVFQPKEITGWTAQLCDALDYAHNHARIIHRDLKPANLMVNQKRDLKVADFGIARSLGDSISKLTMASGGTSGTLVYMSPQQMDGERGTHLDDIYSLGATLYDLLTSKPPFYSGNLNKQIHERTAPSMTERRKEFNIEPALVPPVWEETIAACLAKEPARRPQSVAEVAQRLQLAGPRSTTPATSAAPRPKKKAVLIGAAALLGLVLAGLYVATARRQPTPPVASASLPAPVPEKSVAILPFKPLSSQNRDEALEAGMADTLITKLSTTREIIIPSLTSARKYAEQENDPLAAGRLLRVRSVLEGSVQMLGDRIRVTARLMNVADGASLWAGTFDEKFTDVFAVQDTIAQKVAAALALRLSEEEQKRLTKRYTGNAEAYQLYLTGRFYWNKYTDQGFRKSIEYFKQAVEKDPKYALAYSGLADSYSLLGETGLAPPNEVFSQGRAYAEKALTLDETLAPAHVSLGMVKLFYDWDLTGAEKHLRRAKELNPNYPDAYHFYGHYLQVAGRFEEAIVETKRGVELDPTSLVINAELGLAFYYARQYDQAIAQLHKTLELDPAFSYGSYTIAQAFAQKGAYEEEIAELHRARPLSAEWSFIIGELGYVDAALGKRAEALKVIEQLNERSAREYIEPVLIAYIYIALGDKDQAFAWLEKAYRERSGLMCWIEVEPRFDPLRTDPRFTDLLRRMGLR